MLRNGGGRPPLPPGQHRSIDDDARFVRPVRDHARQQGIGFGDRAHRADADAEASSTYAEAFNKDPQFYDFYRAMQSYQQTFLGSREGQRGRSSIILSPNNDYLRQFRGGR